MNIFYISNDPGECAYYLDDCRLNKMILETAQLLCSAIQLNGGTFPSIYKPTHTSHPCTKWVAENYSHYWWTYNMFVCMLTRYEWDTGKKHACARLEAHIVLDASVPRTHGLDWTPPPNCTPYKDMPVVDAYRKYMYDKWQADYEKGRHHRYYSSTWRTICT